MKHTTLATAALLTTISYSAPVGAANPADVKQLLQTKQCPNCDLVGADLRSDTGINLSGANLSGANLSGARLPKANLQGANLNNAILIDTDLVVANLSKADLRGAQLRGATLNFAYLSKADLSGADLRDATLKGAVLSSANLNNANLNRVSLDDNQLRELAKTQGSFKGVSHPSTVHPWENAEIVYALGENFQWEAVTSLAISHDSHMLAVAAHSHSRVSGGGSSLTLWNLKTGKLIRTLFEGRVGQSWDQPAVAAEQEPQSRRIGLNGDLIYSVAFSPDGQTLAAGMSNKTIKLWNVKTGEEIRTLKGHDYAVHAVAMTPDGQTLVSGSSDKTIKLWNLKTGELLRTIKAHEKPVSTLAISADGRLLASGSDDKTIKIWNLSTGELVRTFSDTTEIQSVAFSPDGQMLASTRYSYGRYDSGVPRDNDPAVKLWNLNTGQQIPILKENFYKDAASVVFSPDGQTLASYVMVHQNPGGQVIKLWNLKTGEQIRTIKGDFPLVFSPNKHFLVTTGGLRVQVWR